MKRLPPRRLLRLAPAPGAWRVAVRAAGTVLVALSVLAALDRLDLAAYATFGAFASVYGGAVPSRSRMHTQVAAAAMLVAAVTTGALTGTLDHRAQVVVPVAAVWAAGAAQLSDRLAWRPPGPMFAVFAVATCASIPTTLPTAAAALGVATATAGFAVLSGVLESVLVHTRHGRLPDRPVHPPPPAHRHLVQAVRCGVAVLLAGTLATWSGLGHPYWAMIASVVPLSLPGLRHQLTRAVHRVVGTVVGLVTAAVLLSLHLPVPATVLVVAALQATTELLVTRHYGLSLVFITPLALLVAQLGHPQPVPGLLVSRLVETALGVAVGVVTAALTRDRHPSGSRTA